MDSCLTADNYVNFLTKGLPLLVDELRLETRRAFTFQQITPAHFGQVAAYLNQNYENR
jgi:hypothetical protein